MHSRVSSLDILNALRNVETIVDLQEMSRAMVFLNKLNLVVYYKTRPGEIIWRAP